MVVSSAASFARAVAEHPFGGVAFDAGALAAARAALDSAGLLVVGERHGVRETPTVLHALASELGTCALGLEWSHEELDGTVQGFLRTGAFDFEQLWRLPATAEIFCGDGRVTAGHFALLARLRREGRLEQVVLFDRLDPVPAPDDWQVRDRELAARLLAEWDERLPLLVAAGAFHARLGPGAGDTMAVVLARARPGVRAAMLDHAGGSHSWRGAVHELSGAMPDAAITFRLPPATPAVVPAPGQGY